eukprot:SAG22_NODE_14153_length_383_cov_0.732394_1_plen_96_part_10
MPLDHPHRGGIDPLPNERRVALRAAAEAKKAAAAATKKGEGFGKGWRKRARGLPLPGLYEVKQRQPLSESREPDSAVVGWAEPGEPVVVTVRREPA